MLNQSKKTSLTQWILITLVCALMGTFMYKSFAEEQNSTLEEVTPQSSEVIEEQTTTDDSISEKSCFKICSEKALDILSNFWNKHEVEEVGPTITSEDLVNPEEVKEEVLGNSEGSI